MTTGKADEVSSRAQGRIGSVLRGKYRIDRVLGVGGMAVVYAATHRNKKRFAVKMLHPELSLHDDIRSRFLREGYVANSVEHPGAVAVLDDDVAEDGAAFIVMELLDGAGVEQVWEAHANRLPARVVLLICYQLLDVLAAAHSRSIVHRDIKPANVFLTRDGTLKVLDFGIARLRDATSEQATQTGMMMGTPAFMAPEQAQGQSSHIDGLTDVWAVGATMFSLLSGSMVHSGDNPQMVMIQAATQPARSLTAAVHGIPPPVVALVDRALAFDKADRWPSAAAMRDAVKGAYEAMFSSTISLQLLGELLVSGHVSQNDRVRSSSDATPGVQAPPPGPAKPEGHIATPVAATPRPRAGATTAQPTSNDAGDWDKVDLPRSSAAKIVVPGIAVLAALVIGGVLASRSGGPSSAATLASAESPLPAIAADAAPAVQAIDAQAVILAPPPEPAAPQGAPLPHVSQQHVGAAPSASIVRRPGPSTAPAPAATAQPCRVVPYFDADGNKRFRQECP